MYQKFIARIGVKAWDDPSEFFQELPLSAANKRSIEISSKEEDSGLGWTVKITAKLRADVILLHAPCIIKVRLRDCYYLIGTPDLPAHPTTKEGELIDLTVEYKTKTYPAAIKKVLSYNPDCE